MNKLARIISELGYDELKLIQKDLNEGNIEKLVLSRLKSFDDDGATVCPVCNAQIIDPDNGGLTLFFGPKDFRRKATFDATDCLEYFITHLKNLSEKKIKKGEIDGTARDNTDI